MSAAPDRIEDWEDQRPLRRELWELRTELFDGPLHALLDLVRRHPGLFDGLAVAMIVQQWLDERLPAGERLSEEAANAQGLAELAAGKASRLERQWSGRLGAEGDGADALVAESRRRARLAAMRRAGDALMERPLLGRDVFGRGDIRDGVVVVRDRRDRIEGADRRSLVAAYDDIRARALEDGGGPPAVPPRLPLADPAAARVRILARLDRRPDLTLAEAATVPGVRPGLTRRSVTAAHLMAALDLAKDGEVTLATDGRGGVVMRRAGGAGAGG